MKNKERAFLNQVAKVLGREKPLLKPPKRDEVGPPVFWKEQKFETDEPLELFKRNLENLTGRVYVASNHADARQQVNAWLEELKPNRVIMWDHEELKKVVDIQNKQIKVDYWTANGPKRKMIETAEQADVGITWADYGIGYTGTLALFSSPIQGRSVSLLPTVHIAILKKENLVPTMSTVIRDIIERRGNNKVPAAIDFITGPSRTSDIEMDLSIGVHGPVKVWVIVLK